MEFSEKVTRLLKEAGLTQEDLGERLGVQQQQVSRWISKNTPPSKWQVLLKMARILGTTVDYLIDPKIEKKSELSEDEKYILKMARDMEMDSGELYRLVKLGLDAKAERESPTRVTKGYVEEQKPKTKPKAKKLGG